MNNNANLEKICLKKDLQILNRRGVAPVIATLLLVAIAVVGGSMVFVFAQEFFGESQISSTPSVEFIKIIGYDTRDVQQVKAHDGIKILPDNCCGESDGLKNFNERIAIYVQNKGIEPVFFSEIRIFGETYEFTSDAITPSAFGIGTWDDGLTKPQPGEFVLLSGHDGTKGGDLLETPAPILQPGETVTILVDLKNSYNIPRDAQFKLTTTNGNIFVSTIIMGQESD